MRIDQLSPLDAPASLESSTEGLTLPEVERRLKKFGRNGVEEVARRPLWLGLLMEFFSFCSVILWVRPHLTSHRGSLSHSGSRFGPTLTPS